MMKWIKYMFLLLVIILLSACQNSTKDNSDITNDNSEKIILTDKIDSSILYYEIRNKPTSELIGTQEISIHQEGDYYILDEKRFLKKEFLVGLGKDLLNIKKYKLNSEYSLVDLSETEYIDNKERYEREVSTRISDNSIVIDTKSTEHTLDGKHNTSNVQIAYPNNYMLSSGSYFQIPFLIMNLNDKYIFCNTLDGKINSYINKGNEDIKNSILGKINSIALTTMDNKVKIWIDPNLRIISQIEEKITDESILVTTLKKIETRANK
ncbi:hypothetical protein [Paenibacillus apiarius]|uniref:hypothetical protein n=1 Tax=Paenibacillus apiarius TaxID=46240 RepID=UPI003B3BA688